MACVDLARRLAACLSDDLIPISISEPLSIQFLHHIDSSSHSRFQNIEWECSACTLKNSCTSEACEACDSVRPELLPASACVVATTFSAHLGHVRAPSSIPLASIALAFHVKRISPTVPGVIRLLPIDARASGHGFDEDALASLATSILLKASLQPHVGKQVPLEYNTAITKDYIDILLYVPADAQPGSCVLIQRVTTAGFELLAAPTQMFVGGNHARSPVGPVTAAVRAQNAVALLRALDSGGSTEEQAEEVG
jgi:hypothetical protein